MNYNSRIKKNDEFTSTSIEILNMRGGDNNSNKKIFKSFKNGNFGKIPLISK